MSSGLDPYQHSVGPDLGPNCLQRLITEDNNRHQQIRVILANSDNPDTMPHDAAFHQGLHRLLIQKRSSKKEIQFCLEIITCDPSNYTMDHSPR